MHSYYKPFALHLLVSGQLDEARIYMELLRQDHENPDLLQPGTTAMWTSASSTGALSCWTAASSSPPGHSHACVALALGYQRAGDFSRARECAIAWPWPPTPGILWPSRTWAPSLARKEIADGSDFRNF